MNLIHIAPVAVTCNVCLDNWARTPATVCERCSNALREGKEVRVDRVGHLPNETVYFIAFRLNDDGEVEWKFPEEGGFSVNRNLELST